MSYPQTEGLETKSEREKERGTFSPVRAVWSANANDEENGIFLSLMVPPISRDTATGIIGVTRVKLMVPSAVRPVNSYTSGAGTTGSGRSTDRHLDALHTHVRAPRNASRTIPAFFAGPSYWLIKRNDSLSSRRSRYKSDNRPIVESKSRESGCTYRLVNQSAELFAVGAHRVARFSRFFEPRGFAGGRP